MDGAGFTRVETRAGAMDIVHTGIPAAPTSRGKGPPAAGCTSIGTVANGGFTMTDIFVESWGAGTPVVLVHGSLATGADEWQAQRTLGEEGYRLLVLDRRGYGRSPTSEGEDFLRDADDIVEVMGDGAHLVGHSYGGLGALLAAARRPAATLSLTLLEAPAFALGQGESAARVLVGDVRRLWDLDLPDEEWVGRFLRIVGSDALPPELIAAAVPLVPVFRRGRPFWEANIPLPELAIAAFPKLVVSGGHSAGFEAGCDGLAEQIGASRAVIKGAGHEVQFTGPPLNQALLQLWRRAAESDQLARSLPLDQEESRAPVSQSGRR